MLSINAACYEDYRGEEAAAGHKLNNNKLKHPPDSETALLS